MRKQVTVLILFVVLAAGCAERSTTALKRTQASPSALPGLSIEQAVLEVLGDLRSMRQIGEGEGTWYSNRAYEYDHEVYKVGYQYRHAGGRSVFGWEYDYRQRALTPVTPFAEQVHP